jgi:hypothetical protein
MGKRNIHTTLGISKLKFFKYEHQLIGLTFQHFVLMPNEFSLYLVRKLEINPSCLKRRFSLGIDANNNEQSILVTLKFDVATKNTKKN